MKYGMKVMQLRGALNPNHIYISTIMTNSSNTTSEKGAILVLVNVYGLDILHGKRSRKNT